MFKNLTSGSLCRSLSLPSLLTVRHGALAPCRRGGHGPCRSSLVAKDLPRTLTCPLDQLIPFSPPLSVQGKQTLGHPEPMSPPPTTTESPLFGRLCRGSVRCITSAVTSSPSGSKESTRGLPNRRCRPVLPRRRPPTPLTLGSDSGRPRLLRPYHHTQGEATVLPDTPSAQLSPTLFGRRRSSFLRHGSPSARPLR